METRDILNKNNVKVGELMLPLNTSEEVWQERLLRYREDGLVFLPNVTPRQIRQAMILSGVAIAEVEQALEMLPEPTRSLAKIEWEYSIAFIRTNPLVAQIGLVLGWDSDRLDNLWRLAASL